MFRVLLLDVYFTETLKKKHASRKTKLKRKINAARIVAVDHSEHR